MPATYTYRRPWLYPEQQASIFHSARYVLIEASTKSGKTVGCLIWLTEQAIKGKGGQNFWWVAPTHGQAKIAYRRLKRALPKRLYKANDTDQTITLRNGAVIWFKSGEISDNLYGEDVYAAVIDEASRMREDSWHAVRSTLTATRGPVRLIGNVKGRRNWFYLLCRRAESGEEGMHYARIGWRDAARAGVIAEDEVLDAQRVLPDAVFRELYEAEPSDDEGNPFGFAAIRARIIPALSDQAAVAFGWDLARKRDWTVGIGLDRSGNAAAFERFQRPWEETFTTIVDVTGTRRAHVDSTGVGDPLVERLQRRAVADTQSLTATAQSQWTGYQFTAPSKQRLMEGLSVAIQHGEVAYPDGPIVHELESFEYVYTRTGVRYSAPEGMHDDCVCALALAVMQLQHMPREVPAVAPIEFTRIAPLSGL